MGNWLGCSCEEKGDTPLFQIKKRRSCTDLPFLLLFVALWAVIIFMLDMAVTDKNANPNRLVRGVDWNASICGVDAGVQDKPLAAWPIIPTSQSLYQVKVCVSSCQETLDNPVFRGPLIQKLTGYKSKQFLYYCIPQSIANHSMLEMTGFNSVGENASRAIGDLFVTWDLVCYSAIIAVCLAFFYMWFCKRMAGVLVWMTIIIVLIGGALLGFAFFQQATAAESTADPSRAQGMKVASYIAWAITALYFIIIVALRKRIKIAVEVVKEASKSVGDMPMMMFFPIIPFVLTLGYFGFWIYGALEIFSVVTVTDVELTSISPDFAGLPGAPTTFKKRAWDQNMQNFFAAHFFHLLWNVQFLIYFSYMVVAGAVANWYFTPYQENGKKQRGTADGQLPRAAVRYSFWRAIRYHLGTIAFGALLIAIVQFIRALMMYLERTSKGKSNRIQKAIFAMVQCILKCVKCCLDKLSTNAFIYCAIYGDPFCVSAWTSFAILWRNLARVAAINMVGSYISVLGKLLVAFGTTGIIIQILGQAEPWKSHVSSPILTAFVVLLLAYMIAAVFMVVYETAVDTIFLCFLLDEEQNKNGQLLASRNLVAIINKYQKVEEHSKNHQQDGTK